MINFGPKAAQDDNDILKYFHKTRQIENVFEKKSEIKGFIFVTRSGCGKTALVKWLNSEKLKREKVYLSSSQFSLICDDESLSLENYKNIIAAELFLGLIDEFKDKLSEPLKKKCNELVKKKWYESMGAFFKTKFAGISVLGNGFNLNPQERKEYLKSIKKTNKIEESGKLLEEISKELNLIVIVDNPESLVTKGLDEVNSDNSKRIGAFLSVLGNLEGKDIQVAAFTKEYIIQSVKKNYIDYNHFSDRICGLEWEKSDLTNMIDNRVTQKLNKTWDDIFKISKKSFEDNILPNLVSGPRDLIDICNTVGRDNDIISKKLMVEEFERLKNDKWNEIDVQYKSQWKNITVFSKQIIETLNNNSLIEFNTHQFQDIIKNEFQNTESELYNLRSKADWIFSAHWNLVEYLELFFLIGLLGYKKGNTKYFTWQGRFIDEFKKSNSYFITPLFLI
ncbi:hypothetical protein D1164_14600 [Mariniphaga sediminis]|uniref:Uncharacterized protein n=1 Tax=Mariniphaga sediminis TaxID=1628158 RepID=A0A399D0X5_9BACT|nr:hypothetical protein [Mariniphaga sediminis]RIH64321.1 hypothetical protein D1164_14600 [Mariniphaga sediminis]